MENLFSYVKKWQNYSLLTKEFNNIDSLIFCALAYLKFDDCLQYDEEVTIHDLYLKYQPFNINNNIFYQHSEKLLKSIYNTTRYKDIKVTNYKRINDVKIEKQFGAMTFILPSNQRYIAFSGTDATLTGWKENFNLSYLTVIPSQQEAKNYVEEISSKTTDTIFIGGHSKGGNLAMYAAIYCNKKDQEKIIKVYNYDGPGLPKEVFKTKEFLAIQKKIKTYVPKFSIVGYLFYNETDIQFIFSYQLGFLEHDLFSWVIQNDNFAYLSPLNNRMKTLIDHLNHYIESIPLEKRKEIISLVYDLITLKPLDINYHQLLKINPISKEDYQKIKDIMLILTNSFY